MNVNLSISLMLDRDDAIFIVVYTHHLTESYENWDADFGQTWRTFNVNKRLKIYIGNSNCWCRWKFNAENGCKLTFFSYVKLSFSKCSPFTLSKDYHILWVWLCMCARWAHRKMHVADRLHGLWLVWFLIVVLMAVLYVVNVNIQRCLCSAKYLFSLTLSGCPEPWTQHNTIACSNTWE